MTIALPETRELDLLARMVERNGAATLRCPLVEIVDTDDVESVGKWLDSLEAGEFTDVLFYTGEGLRRLLAFADRRGSRQAVVDALTGVRKICRGPKPAKALHEIGLTTDLRVEPATTAGIVELFKTLDWKDRNLGIQLFDANVPRPLAEWLAAAQVQHRCVSPYRYSPAVDEVRVVQLIESMRTGEVDVIAFTSAAQVDRLFNVAAKRNLSSELKEALGRLKVAAVGPVAADALKERGVAVPICPDDKYFMKPLVDAIIEATRQS